jgi:hypothetical protein
VLLRARTSAVAGAAALRRGRVPEAARLFEQALQLHRGVTRELELPLPAAIQVSGGAVAEHAAALLRRSPRFVEASGGFTARIHDDGGGDVRARLDGPSGNVVAETIVSARSGEPVEDQARRLVAEFHEQAFAPRVELTQATLRSLDGSPLAAGNARWLSEGVMERLSGTN